METNDKYQGAYLCAALGNEIVVMLMSRATEYGSKQSQKKDIRGKNCDFCQCFQVGDYAVVLISPHLMSGCQIAVVPDTGKDTNCISQRTIQYVCLTVMRKHAENIILCLSTVILMLMLPFVILVFSHGNKSEGVGLQSVERCIIEKQI